jgi:hypothetical protein
MERQRCAALCLDRPPTEDDARREQRRQCDAVGDLGDRHRGRAERRRGDEVASKAVDCNRNHDVQRDRRKLQDREGRNEVARGVAHLGEHRHEARVAGVGVRNVQARREALAERRVARDDNLRLPSGRLALRARHAEADRRDEHGGNNRHLAAVQVRTSSTCAELRSSPSTGSRPWRQI